MDGLVVGKIFLADVLAVGREFYGNEALVGIGSLTHHIDIGCAICDVAGIGGNAVVLLIGFIINWRFLCKNFLWNYTIQHLCSWLYIQQTH